MTEEKFGSFDALLWEKGSEEAKQDARRAQAAPSVIIRTGLNTRLNDLQKLVSWGVSGNEIAELEAEIRVRAKGIPASEIDREIRRARDRGETFRRQWSRLDAVLSANPHAPELQQALTSSEFLPEVRDKLARRLKKLETQRQAAQSGTPRNPRAPVVVREHRINMLQARTEWTLWIDETGECFDAESRGRQGKMLGLLFPAQTGFRQLPPGSHAANMSEDDALRRLNEVLNTTCGIFGITFPDMTRIPSGGWHSMLVRLVGWVMRLLPLPEQGETRLSIHIEARSDFQSSIEQGLLKKDFRLLLNEEADGRGGRILLGDVGFVDKDRGYLAWADLLANFWGSPSFRKEAALKDAGLMGTCLFTDEPAFFDACEIAVKGKLLDKDQWQTLLSRRDAGMDGSLTSLALERLKLSCGSDASAWKLYIDAMAEYLAGRAYDLNILERQAKWLREGMSSVSLPPLVRFYAALAELAQLNHKGVVSSPELDATKKVVEELADLVAEKDSDAACHAALRLAVNDTNAFDFEGAVRRLDRWNPVSGGELPRAAEWAGKVVSSLGQAEAFLGRTGSALQCFEIALEQFGRLSALDPRLAERQRSQTAVYAAVAAMDMPECSRAEAALQVCRALRCDSIEDAVMSSEIKAAPYSHYLLVRFLSAYGSEEEKRLYSRECESRLSEETQNHHPWELIWYHRRLIVGEESRALLAENIRRCRGVNGATVDVICLALEIGIGITDPASPEIQELLASLAPIMPKAKSRLDALACARPGQRDIVETVLSFNYR